MKAGGIALETLSRTPTAECGHGPQICIALPFIATPPPLWAIQSNEWQRKAIHCNESAACPDTVSADQTAEWLLARGGQVGQHALRNREEPSPSAAAMGQA